MKLLTLILLLTPALASATPLQSPYPESSTSSKTNAMRHSHGVFDNDVHYYGGPCDQKQASNGICVTKAECQKAHGRVLKGDLCHGAESNIHCCAILNCAGSGSYCDWWCPNRHSIGVSHCYNR
ncbi:hypothetical protein AOQ84DRAFT_420002 [Glonium stellatum]|uniref:Uncharacterized protein n=1 Tax=Glonium stellatum TaxID=574774 RepID=A0A8E2F864_9PEZI|nr:hypothetical protein AOQ84DRAFT_420002 [Glonium stellatum]